MNKKFISIVILIVFAMNAITVYAQNEKNSFIVSQDIPSQQPYKQTCIDALRLTMNEESQIDENDEDEQKLAEYTQRLNEINSSIDQIESGEEDSIQATELYISELIDQIIIELSESYPDFEYLTEEEQMQLVSENQVYQEWHNYLMSLESDLKDLLEEKSIIENSIQQLHYDQEMQTEHNEKGQNSNYQQCLLFPYSVEQLEMNQLDVLDPNLNFADYLVSLNKILDRIIPKTYRSLKYSDIFDQYQRILNHKEESKEMNQKSFIEFDDYSISQYTYAKEFGMNEVDALARIASQTKKEDMIVSDYMRTLSIKDEQFRYFEAINMEVFSEIKSRLSSYLNEHHLFDKESYQKIKDLQMKYQVKFVWLDENSSKWLLYQEHNNGFYDEYTAKNLSTTEKMIEDLTTEIDMDVNSDIESDNKYSTTPIFDAKEIPKKKSQKHSIKDKLLNKKHKPNKNKDKLKKDLETTKEKSLKDHFKLPKTGESTGVILISTISIIMGILIMIIDNTKTKKS